MAFYSIDYDYAIDYNYDDFFDFETSGRFIVPVIPQSTFDNNNNVDGDGDSDKGFGSVSNNNNNCNEACDNNNNNNSIYYMDNERRPLKRCFSPYEHYWNSISKPNNVHIINKNILRIGIKVFSN